MASWEMRIEACSGKSTQSLAEVCSGIQARSQRHSWRRLSRPFVQTVSGRARENAVGPRDPSRRTVLDVAAQERR